MTLLWISVALVLLASLAFIWYPHIRHRGVRARVDRTAQNVAIFKDRLEELERERDQGNVEPGQFEDLKRELELNLLQEVPEEEENNVRDGRRHLWLPLGLTVLIPLLSLVLYLQWGYSEELAMPRQAQSASQEAPPHDLNNMEQQLAALRQRLQENPENTQGWFMLGRTYMTLNRYGEAYEAFAHLSELLGDPAEILAQQATALYYGAGRQVTADVRRLVERALAKDPGDPGTLGLLGISAYDSGQYAQAIEHWQKLVGSDHPNVNREGLRNAIAQAREQLQRQGISPPTQSEPAQTEAAGAEIRVKVGVAPELQGSLPPQTTVFVVAQALNGPPMPLAVARLQLADLPTEVVLNDGMAMGPMAKLSSADQVQLKAMVSRSGTPGAKPGDLQGLVKPVAVQNPGGTIDLLIDERVQ